MTVLDLSGLDDQTDTVKAEFCLLASFVNPSHASVSGLEIADPVCLAYAARMLPGLYSSDLEYEEQSEPVSDMERRFLAGIAVDLDEPATDYDTHPIIASHRVFWSTGYGASPVDRPDVVDLLAGLDCSETLWAAEICIATLFAGGVPPAEALTRSVPGSSLSWDTYHEHLARELLEALL